MPDDVADRMEQLGAFIRAQRRGQRLSLRRLSEGSGISNPYLSQIERGLRKPSAEVLQQIARALSVPVEQLYVRAGILEAQPVVDLESRIRTEPTLTADQQEALVKMFRELQREGPAAR